MMSNRLLLYMTILVIAGMATLFALNLALILNETTQPQTHLNYNDVKGMAIKHQGLLYTLNFQQQNQVIEILNKSIRISQVNATRQRKIPDFEEIVIYQFEDKPDLIVTPIASINNKLIYSIPEWNQGGYLMEASEGELKRLLPQTYD